MSKDLNNVVLTGRLIKNTEFKEYANSTVCNNSIAVNRSVKKDGKYEEVASFINIRFFASSPKQIEFYKNSLTKGAAITLEGQLISDSYEKDGKKSYFTYVLCSSVIPHEKKASSSSQGSTNEKLSTPQQEEFFPEDIPF